MLKIKDSVDLKELEKFGFRIFKTNKSEFYRKKLNTSGNLAFITIQPISREVKIGTESTYILDLSIIYDLTLAGLVEKVESEDSNE